jgi:hypothetical protein
MTAYRIRFVTLICTCLLVSGTAIAQSRAQGPATDPGSAVAQNSTPSSGQDGIRTFKLQSGQPSSFTMIPLQGGHSCPIYMHAEQRSGGDVMNARRIEPGEAPRPSNGPTQRIHLILRNLKDSADITRIKVSVHGTSGKSRTLKTELTPDEISDAAKAFDLPVSIRKDEGASTNLVLQGFTSVQSITLESVTYADGSSWSSSAGGTCRIAPDPLVLVSVR